MKKVILKVEGMTCSACSNHVEKYVKKQKGVIDVSVNLVLGQALIYYEDNILIDTLFNYINESGYKCGGIYDEKEENKKDNSKIFLIILGGLMVLIMYISMGHMLHLPIMPCFDMMFHPIFYSVTLFFLTLPYLGYGMDIIIAGIKNLINKAPNMDTLVTLGVSVSFFYSVINMILIIFGNQKLVANLYFESVCMIILFIKIGRYIDKFSKEKTKEAIKELVEVTPKSALLKVNKEEKEVTIDEVKVGDILIVKTGMKVAVDGKIVKGSAHFDESFITGESKPSKKVKGDKIMAGAINYDGVVEYEALKIGPKSTISDMVRLVLMASNSKMPIAKIVDKISFYFVPVILILAILTFIIYLFLGFSLNDSLIRMVTVLVVACPCALGLATPLAVVVSIGVLARKNVLVKSSEILEIASHIDTIVFDKTGTLTYGKLKVSKLYNYSNYSNKELLNIVANIEGNSLHPISLAFKGFKTSEAKVLNYKEISGMGVKAIINNKEYYLGNNKIVKKIKNTHFDDELKLSLDGNSIIYVLEDNKIIGLIGVKDIIRNEAKNVVKELKTSGYKVVMLTGDNEISAKLIGKKLDIDEVIANVLPKEKSQYIKDLMQSGRKVIMIGDGINDAPSLATANIGISFKSGTDIASNSSSVIITNDNIKEILTFLKMGKRTLRNIKQNLFWAFFYNILMIPLAMGVFKGIGLDINPMIASGLMMISSLCVVFNALRLKND